MFKWFGDKNIIDENSIAKKGDYVVVIHNWFVDSKGFKHFVFKDMTLEQVKKEAKALKCDHEFDFCKADYHIIKIE